MLEVLVFDTPEEASVQLAEYEKHNNAVREILQKREKPIEEIFRENKQYFALELIASLSDYAVRSTVLPFKYDGLFDDLLSLVEGVKTKLNHYKVYNLEPVFYTVKDHSQENQETNELFKGVKPLKLVKDLAHFFETDITDFSRLPETEIPQEFPEINEMGLSPAEIEEFKELYHKLSSKPSQD